MFCREHMRIELQKGLRERAADWIGDGRGFWD
jgi:hypothetical protein